MNLNYIETFILVTETGSFTRAAKARNMTKAAVSKHISQLESDLGVSLFSRSTRTLSLTEEGAFVYEECKRIVDNVAEVEGMLSSFKAEPTGLLTIISGPVFGRKYIIPHLVEFHQKYPKIHLKLNLCHLMPNMVEDKIDIVVAVFGTPSPDAIQKTVLHTRRLLCASPAYLAKKGTPEHPTDLLKHPLMIHPHHLHEQKLSLKTELTLYPHLITHDQLTIKQCALQGMGIGYLQSHSVEDELKNGQLVEILPGFLNPKEQIPINLYYLKRKHLHSKVRCFIDFLFSKIQEPLKQHKS